MNANDIQGFHIELTNMCTLKCPGCARTRFIDQWPQHWNNYNLNVDHLLEFLDIDLSRIKIHLCGNYGDPIYHLDFLTIIEKLKSKNSSISITTNGSYKSVEWWHQLTSLLDSTDEITFSVDGIPDNFAQYRINADWNSIKKGMEVVASASCKSQWKYLVFAFNQNNISEAQELCKQIGIKKFKLDYSDRFDEQTQNLIPTKETQIGKRYHAQELFKQNVHTEVRPSCMLKQNEHFITADGFYSPCCYVADHRFYYKTDFGKNKKKYSISDNKLSALLEKPEVVGFYNNLQNHPVCQYNCPKI